MSSQVNPPIRVIITGASSGLGAALAKTYANRGARLGLIARRSAELNQLAAQLDADVAVYPADVSDTAAMRSATEDYLQHFGCPDIVIANAGISIGTLTEKVADTDVLREVMDTNLTGMVNTFQPFVAAMRERGHGVLVGIASVAGFRGLPGAGAYSASKAAVISYLESLRVELHNSGVKVITICPGYIDTPMTRHNPYRMPFMMQPKVAAEKIIAAIAGKRCFVVIPWQMALVGGILKILPRPIYDRLFATAPRKPRRD